MNLNDKIVPMPKLHRSGIYQRTRVMGGYGLRRDFNGVTSLGEKVFDDSNMIPIGGCQYCFEQLMGVKGPLHVPTLYEISGGTIGLPDVSMLDYATAGDIIKYYIPALNGDQDYKDIIHPQGEYVCLFGAGLTGSAVNILTKPPVDYKEYAIQNSLATEDGHEMTGVMIPFRYTEKQLTDTERIKYFGKTADWTASNVDNIGYYLKRFEEDPVIKHFWKAASDDTESTNQVSQNEYYPRENTANSSDIDTYCEMILKITPKDMKQWFDATSNIDETRVNTIALFTGRYNKLLGDYENVRLFSKLTFKVNSLDLAKDFVIIYRIYSS
ncbi:MAG: hypothetical protein K2L37_06080, partial [Lactobacillus sp.]|nr:hypothetical protein [Lactobacillus sp.]